jgi:hypothetical protein
LVAASAGADHALAAAAGSLREHDGSVDAAAGLCAAPDVQARTTER